MYWSQISDRKLKNSISHGVVILASEPDAMLSGYKLTKSTVLPKSLAHFQNKCYKVFLKKKEMTGK